MKLWYGFGSEHSMNLVMIGHFKDVRSAEKAKEVIERISKQATLDSESGQIGYGGETRRFSEAMIALFSELKLYSLGSIELEQFTYDVHIKHDRDKLVFTTDESDVSAFIKILVEHGARVEVYSGDCYPDSSEA